MHGFRLGTGYIFSTNCLTPDPSSDCTSGSVQLVGGESSVEGRVELCIDGDWSTVCDEGWDGVDAAVTCQQLNLPHSGKFSLVTSLTHHAQK